MTKDVKLLLLAGGLFWLAKQFGKPGIDSEITGSFQNSGFTSSNAMWWAAVSRFETANYTSTLAKQYNNFFGMTFPGQTGINTGKAGFTNFLSYASIADSVRDVVRWVELNNLQKNYPDLQSMIYAMSDHNYFTEDRDVYLSGVKADLQKIV